MIPVNNFKGIINQESNSIDNHIIILLLVKPSDNTSQEIIPKFNYFHKKSGNYCNIYPIGYSEGFTYDYKDVIKVKGVDNKNWQYSDHCFIEFIDDISNRLKSWRYVEDVQVVILQNAVYGEASKLDFTNYLSIDINYGINNGYIESFAKFMGYLIEASKSEVRAKNAVKKANKLRYSYKSILEAAISLVPKLPKSVKHILKDRTFYIPSNRKR